MGFQYAPTTVHEDGNQMRQPIVHFILNFKIINFAIDQTVSCIPVRIGYRKMFGSNVGTYSR